MIELVPEIIEGALYGEAKSFAKDSVNIFWLRDIKIPRLEGSKKGEMVVPTEEDIYLFCCVLAAELCKRFTFSFENKSLPKIFHMSFGPVSCFVRIQKEETEKDVKVSLGFTMSLSEPELYSLESFLKEF